MSTSNESFHGFKLEKRILDELDKRSITSPTPIQIKAIPDALQGSDVIGIAQTGTGKTLAFVLPLIQQIITKPGTIVILAPTRELAQQTQETCDWFKQSMGIRTCLIIGGASMQRQLQDIRKKPHIIIATPGRLIDHLKHKNLQLKSTKYLVLDEADRMFDMGFAPQIKEIITYMPSAEERQTLLFSATMPDAIANLVAQNMRQPIRIEIAAPGTTAKNVQQEMVIIDNAHRQTALLELLEETNGAVLIFTRTKFQAKKLTQFLRDKSYGAEELHSNRSLPQRQKAVAAIQSGRSTILVATDIAARGIDIAHLKLVVNYELPDNPEDYVHRIGRTGRAGKQGRAVSFVLIDQADQLRQIQRLIDEQINQTHLNTVPSATLQAGGGGSRGGSRARSGSSNRFQRGRSGSSSSRSYSGRPAIKSGQRSGSRSGGYSSKPGRSRARTPR